MISFYNRKEEKYENDNQYGGKALNFLYNTCAGRILLKIAINPMFSKLNGIYNKSFLSKGKIKKFNVDLSQYENKNYKSFNDFFTRKKININFDKNKLNFISPADSKLLIYKIEKGLNVKIKNSVYTLEELTHNSNLNEFENGYCMVFRLSMDDYHRYCFVDEGTIEKQYKIKGKLHTVSSISQNHKVYSQNSRVCNYLKTKNFDNIVVIEVGALLVGKISNYNIKEFSKGQEKGFFEIGGSTIVILTKNIIKVDEDILKNSKNGIETKVSYGEKIAQKI